MKPSYEVIIVGAGPAGSTLAYELAKTGIGVLLLEKEKLPRYKCCAGGISIKAANLLGIDFHEVIEDSISGTVVTFKNDNHYQGHYDKTLIYMVTRERFDYVLVEKAAQAGATVMPGCKVEGANLEDRGVEVLTPVGSFQSKIVAGADGTGSIVANVMGLTNHISNIAAIQSEVLVPKEEMAKWRGNIGVDFGRISGGYGWVFPKADHLSIGMAFLHSRSKGLKQYYQKFLDSLNISSYTIAKQSGSLIPICKGEAVVSQGRAVLLGDAAGLVDPLTGEGIYNAILSAKLAAPAIQNSLLQDTVGLPDYQKAIEERVMPELKIARSLSRALVRFP